MSRVSWAALKQVRARFALGDVDDDDDDDDAAFCRFLRAGIPAPIRRKLTDASA